MVPAAIDRFLSTRTGAIGSAWLAYKWYRWGDPHVRLLSRLCDRRRISVDVGAHFGEFTIFMRFFSASVIAFECNPALANGLKTRFGASVDIRPDAVSNVSGTAQLRIPKLRAEVNLGRATIEGSNELRGDFTDVLLVPVKTVRLDDVVAGRVGLIKVDVEGHEMAVLEGAARILREDRPNLIVELEERHSAGILEKGFGLLKGLGYQASYLSNGRLIPYALGDNAPPGLWNYVFTHPGRK